MQCTRTFEFDAAHRIINHEGKCKFLHGHRYKIDIHFAAKNLDNLGRIIDYGNIKNIFGNWIDSNLDHNLILSEEDRDIGEIIAKKTGQGIYYVNFNVTSENLARHLLFDVFINLMNDKNSIKCIGIRLYETPNCFVDIKQDDVEDFPVDL